MPAYVVIILCIVWPVMVRTAVESNSRPLSGLRDRKIILSSTNKLPHNHRQTKDWSARLNASDPTSVLSENEKPIATQSPKSIADIITDFENNEKTNASNNINATTIENVQFIGNNSTRNNSMANALSESKTIPKSVNQTADSEVLRHSTESDDNLIFPESDEEFYSSEDDPLVLFQTDNPVDSFEDNRRRFHNQMNTFTSRTEPQVDAGENRPFYVPPRPVRFELPRLNQRGCKTTMKEVKEIPKAEVLATQVKEGKVRPRREAKQKLTSVLITKECFFPGDEADVEKQPGFQTDSTHKNSHIETKPVPQYEEPWESLKMARVPPTVPAVVWRPVASQASGALPKTQVGENVPQNNMVFWRPPHRVVSPNGELTPSASNPHHRRYDEEIDGPFRDYYQDQNAKRDMHYAQMRQAESVPYGYSSLEEPPHHRSHPYMPSYADEGGRSYGGQYQGGGEHRRGSRRNSSGSYRSPSHPRGRVSPRNNRRSFSYFRRKGDPKNNYAEEFSNGRAGSYRSDYDSRRDGLRR